MLTFSQTNRALFIDRLSKDEFDLLVIGGGITGCGIALDAALRGLKVALLEKADFASGTSSRSTKLIHGGLRYLKQLEFKLVKDVGTERATVHRIARHIVIPEKMLLPIIENGSLGKNATSLGLMVYDVLAGVPRNEWRVMLDRHQTAKEEPLLAPDNLQGGGMYFEYRTDDSRLVIELAKSAYKEGATLLNYAEVTGFTYNSNGNITGAEVKDNLSGKQITVKARQVVNAAGPWVDLLRKKDQSLKGKRLQLTKGVHIVFPYHKLPVKQSVYFDVPDGRMIFAIARDGVTYVGTTDTVYNENPDQPVCTRADAEYILNAVNKMFPSVKLTLNDIESSWAGLRPLIHEDGKSPSELSRKDEIMESASGLLSIAGGKLTGYRLMAEKITNLVCKKLGKPVERSKTKNYVLSGGHFASDADFKQQHKVLTARAHQAGLTELQANRWFYRYGSNMSWLLENLPKHITATSSLNNAYLQSELEYAVQHEMVYYPTDFIIRRTGKLYFDYTATLAELAGIESYLKALLQYPEPVYQQIVDDTQKDFELAVACKQA